MANHQTHLWLWLVWVAGFLGTWLFLVIGNGWWGRVADHWPISVAMALGSYVAGSTPMGGGTVGFPVLVLLFDQPADFGRQFSFFIQSIGMTSASIFILCARMPIARTVIPWAMVGSAISMVITHYVIFPQLSGTVVKLAFACIWGGFGIVTLVKLKQLLSHHHAPTLGPQADMRFGLVGGLIGGVASGLTGVGVDMVVYTVLVLIFRSDLKPAIATSVILMAWNSLLGTGLTVWDGAVEAEVVGNWLAASPIVLFGAPLGAWVVSKVRRGPTLVFVSALCVLQLVWTLSRIDPTPEILGVTVGAVLALNVVFHFMYAYGRRLRPDAGEHERSLLHA
ncbi:MAG: sulfite exporter TauE/SafE family protein [Gemmatimonadetes bacterium]|nr:sulfite exporter TauE/SafE family protein [Gemmatimonadota bacterium]